MAKRCLARRLSQGVMGRLLRFASFPCHSAHLLSRCFAIAPREKAGLRMMATNGHTRH